MTTDADITASRIASICATISVTCGLVIISLILYHGRYKSTSGRLLLLLFCSDLIQSISTTLSYKWWDNGPSPGFHCDLQAWLQSMGDMTSITASASIAVHLLLAIFQWSGAKIEIIAIVLTISLPVLFALLGFFITNNAQYPYWAPSGGWCWISSHYPTQRWAFFYAWVLLVLVILCVLYGIIIYRLSLRNSLQINARINIKRQRTMQKMFGFPLIFTLVYAPIAVNRIVTAVGGEVPLGLLYVSNALYGLSGFLNAILYGITRYQVFSRKSPSRIPLLQQRLGTSTELGIQSSPKYSSW